MMRKQLPSMTPSPWPDAGWHPPMRSQKAEQMRLFMGKAFSNTLVSGSERIQSFFIAVAFLF
jgi:hypothetical protein